jgi:DNA-binding transcriptional ArsR family regulator
MEKIEEVSLLMKVVSLPRMNIITTLRERGEMTVGDLAEAVQTSSQNINHHLKALSAKHLVKLRSEGAKTFVSFNDELAGIIDGVLNLAKLYDEIKANNK